MKFMWLDWVVRPGLAASIMGGAVYLLKKLLPGGRISTVLCVAAGVIVYGAAAYLLKAVTKDDLRALSGRNKA